MSLIKENFPGLTPKQEEQFEKLLPLYKEWNERINMISRKDMDNFYERHVLHSLAIAKFISFVPGTRILDLGTGGGFPGIPLAIFFPGCHFTLVDSIGKKIKVVEIAADDLGLKNVKAIHGRAESLLEPSFEFVVSRAVAPMPELIKWSVPLISRKVRRNEMPNGIIALKGGDLSEELKGIRHTSVPLSKWFNEEFFETKQLIYWRL